MNKILISSTGNDLNAKIDIRFGRAKGFILYDLTSMEFKYIDNSKVDKMSSGAGIKTAEMAAKLGIDAVLTGNIGPKAKAILNAAGIKCYEGLAPTTIKETIKTFKEK